MSRAATVSTGDVDAGGSWTFGERVVRDAPLRPGAFVLSEGQR